jgi:uncharacterized protein (TIGR03545 family)
MRIKGIIFLLVLVGLGFAATFFITDNFVEEKIEYQASLVNEAKVEIDGFEFELFGLKMAWDRLQVANPNNTMMNTFETGRTEFDVQFWPLMWKKVVIDNIQMTEFRLETERETDGYFEIPVDEETGEEAEPGFIAQATKEISNEVASNARMEFTDVKDDINVDSLMAMVNIQSVDKMDSLQNGLRNNYAKWDSTINNNSIERKATQIRANVDSIKLDQIKKPEEAIAAIKKVQTITKQADSIKKEIQNLRDNFQTDLSNSRQSIGSIDDWVQADIERARNVAKLPDLNAQSIGTALFGQNLLTDFNKYLEYAAIAREYGNRFIGAEEKEDKPERYEGVDYAFSDKYDWPGFWIKNIELSGYTNTNIAIAGEVTNISTDQKKTGEPILIGLSGEDENQVALTVDGEINYLEEEPRETINVKYAGFSLQNTKISPSELLPYDLEQGKGELSFDLSIIDKRIDSEIGYAANDIRFDFAGAGAPKGQVERLIRNAIGSTDRITASVLVDNLDGPLKVKVRSNVDDLFLNALKETVSREVENAKRKIREEVESRVTEKKQEVEELVREKEEELRAEYDKLEAQINERLKVIEEKKAELEKKKKELEEELKNKALDTIRDRIGF